MAPGFIFHPLPLCLAGEAERTMTPLTFNLPKAQCYVRKPKNSVWKCVHMLFCSFAEDFHLNRLVAICRRWTWRMKVRPQRSCLLYISLLFVSFRTSTRTNHNRCSGRRGRLRVGRRWGLSFVLLHRLCVCVRVFLSQQVGGDVPRLGPRVLRVLTVVAGGLERAPALLVLTPEAPEFGAPVFPPLEGQSGAVCHQATLLRGPAPLPFLCANQEERPTHLEAGAATAEVTVWDPERQGAPANVGGGPGAENCLYWDGELPPGTWALPPSDLHLQHCERFTNINYTAVRNVIVFAFVGFLCLNKVRISVCVCVN